MMDVERQGYSKRLAAAYTLGFLARRVSVEVPKLFGEASKQLLDVLYNPSLEVDTTDSAGLDAAMYGVTALGPAVTATITGTE